MSGLQLMNGDEKRHSGGHKILATGHYSARIIELKTSIAAEEEKFKTLVSELDDIRAGKWDDRIMHDLGLKPLPEEPPADAHEEAHQETVGEEHEAAHEEAVEAQLVAAEPPTEEPAYVHPEEPDEVVEETPPAEEAQKPEEEIEVAVEVVTEETDSKPQSKLLDYESSPIEEPEEIAPMEVETDEAAVEGAVVPDVDEEEEIIHTPPEDTEIPSSVPAEPSPAPVDEPIEEAVAEPPMTAETEETEEPIPVTPPPQTTDDENLEPDTEDVTMEPSEVAEVVDEAIEEEIEVDVVEHPEPTIEVEPEPVAEDETVHIEVEDAAPEDSKSEPELSVELETVDDSLVPPPSEEVTETVEVEVEVEAEAEPEQAEEEEAAKLPESRSEGKRKLSDAGSDGQRERKRPREESEPMAEDDPGTPSSSSVASHPLSRTHAGPNTRSRRKSQVPIETPAVSKRFQNVIGMLHSTISQHRYGNIFHNPIKKTEAPDYHDIVKRPMDLKTIKARVKDGVISNSLEFQRDVYLMFANAMMYNRPGSEIYNMAEEMMLESEVHINTFRQTEGFHRG
ncbi:hypothetical protein EUX98_g5233 [Antrodiella citrinella]|uniref:Bromo domain-containing protein n=1 Tax=Antrodiella citrinella TaxID=2447956 RepID=A0A4S4MRX5_9APHY|nr:hypothetical protein EUX98_g5233 [Antrodiella citrinella]